MSVNLGKEYLAWKPIQIALAAEATVNIYGVICIYQNPSSVLDLILPKTTIQTDALKSQVEWVAALTLGVTLGILACIPDHPDQTAARRSMYITFMGFEACMVGTALAQYIRGNSGFTDESLFGTMAIFAFFTGLRIFFLYIKPEWMTAASKARGKAKLK